MAALYEHKGRTASSKGLVSRWEARKSLIQDTCSLQPHLANDRGVLSQRAFVLYFAP